MLGSVIFFAVNRLSSYDVSRMSIHPPLTHQHHGPISIPRARTPEPDRRIVHERSAASRQVLPVQPSA